MTGQPLFRPCTPYGVSEDVGIDRLPSTWRKMPSSSVHQISSANRKPCCYCKPVPPSRFANSKTRDLGAHTRNADILVVATGKRNIVTADMVKPGAVVPDVGMNRDDEGKLCGDVDYANVKEVAGYTHQFPVELAQ